MITLQDIAVKFLGQIKHFSLQIKRDESLTKRFNPVQIKVEICVTLYFIPSPPGLDTKQTRGNMATDTVNCSFSGFGKSSCRGFRGSDTVCRLREFQEDITIHLKTCHLSKLSGMMEYELILIRAGLFDVPPHRQEEMFVCPKHRHNLGRNWRPLRTCRYPLHSGARKKLKNDHVINLEMSKNIHAIFGITTPIGSGKHSTTQYFTFSLF